MENIENINVETVENEEVIEMEVEKQTIVSKIGNGVKKHWKKGVALIGVGALGFILGKKSSNSDDCDYDDYDEADVIEVEFETVDETE